MKSSISLQVALGCLVAAGCRGRPTYDKDVGPILARSCVRCHRAGGVARFPLLERGSQAVAAAKEIRLAVERRDMPPWLAD
ncbi:MAG: hypothetical protein ACJ79M_14895, partial [Myxococcales bacterium]